MNTNQLSIKKNALKVIIPFSVALFFSFPILIFYVSDSFNNLKKENAELLQLKAKMESIYITYSKQAKHRKNLFIRGFRQKDLDKYYKRITKASDKLYKDMDELFTLPKFAKYKPQLEKIKLEHIQSIQQYDKAVEVFIEDNFDFLKADKLTRGHGKEIGKDILKIIASIEKDIVDKSSNKYEELTKELIYLSAILLVSFSIVMYFLIRVILNPLTRISNLSEYVSGINLNSIEENKQYPLDHNDEIGNLIQVFNKFSTAIFDYNKNLQHKIKERTQELDEANILLSTTNKNLNDAVNYSSLLQDAIRPAPETFNNYFEDSFIYWNPKSKVGGDIYFFDILPNENESIIMCIDCTGHSISGAFVTMIVKSIQHEIIRKISRNKFDISPAMILSTFNQRIKDVLKQHDNSSNSNAGFDGGILYINKEKGLLKYAGAYLELITVENNETKIMKPNHYSVGYKKCSYDYQYTDTEISFNDTIKVYLTTDGILDTIGGARQFRFGKRRLVNMIKDLQNLPFEEQKTNYLTAINEYRSDNVQVDDMCFIGLKINRRI